MSAPVLTQNITPVEQTVAQLQYAVLMGTVSATSSSGAIPIVMPDGTTWYITGQAILDTSTHYSAFHSSGKTSQRSFFAYSTLNQSVTLQLFGSLDSQVTAGALTNKYTITGGTGQPANPTVPANAGWVFVGTITDLHYNIQLSATASTAPSSGVLILIMVVSS